MASDLTFEEGIQALIDKAQEQREEVRARYALRLQEELSVIDEKLEHYHCTLNDYLVASGTHAGMSVPNTDDASLVKAMRDSSYRHTIRLWADAHGRRVVMKDLINFITEAGLVNKKMEAHRAIYSAMAFAMTKGEYEKVEPGVYQSAFDVFNPPVLSTPEVPNIEGEI